jgi:hypothetical protein
MFVKKNDFKLKRRPQKRNGCAFWPTILLRLGSVDKFDPVSGRREVWHTEKGFRELVVACCDGSVDLEVADDPLDPVPLAIKGLVIAELPLPVRLRRNDSLDAAFSGIATDGVRVVGLVAKQRLRSPVGKINQRFVGFACPGVRWKAMERPWKNATRHATVRYRSGKTENYRFQEQRSYPKSRLDFRPPAYVVLTREIGTKSDERHA